MTIAFEDYVLKSLINSTIKDVAEKLHLTEEVVQGIVNRRISTDYDWEANAPKAIGLDEIALRKGHQQYLTIITDLSVRGETKVIAVIDGRTIEQIAPTLNKIPDNVLFNMETICADMSASYIPALKARISNDVFFNQVVTIDRFHVAKLVGEKVDKQRKKLMNELKETLKNDEKKLEEIKGSMWPFRHHLKDLNGEQTLQLNTLFSYSEPLKQAYYLREELFCIFENKELNKESAKIEIDAWIKKAEQHDAFKVFRLNRNEC